MHSSNKLQDIKKIATTIECLREADDDTLNIIFKHVQDVVTLARILKSASTQLLGVQHVAT